MGVSLKLARFGRNVAGTATRKVPVTHMTMTDPIADTVSWCAWLALRTRDSMSAIGSGMVM